MKLFTSQLRSTPASRAVPRPGTLRSRRHNNRAAFSLIEILVVVGIIVVLAGLVVTMASNMTEWRKVQTTKAVLANLDAAIDEYHTQTGNYFATIDAPSTASPYGVPERAAAMGTFIQTVLTLRSTSSEKPGIENYLNSIGGLYTPPSPMPNPDDGSLVPTNGLIIDGWGNPLMFYNPGPTKRPLIWSFGKNGVNDSPVAPANSSAILPDDIGSAGGAS